MNETGQWFLDFLNDVPYAPDKKLPKKALREIMLAKGGHTDRQILKPYAAKVLNTATGEADERTRGWMATDWLVRELTPAWLRVAGLGGGLGAGTDRQSAA